PHIDESEADALSKQVRIADAAPIQTLQRIGVLGGLDPAAFARFFGRNVSCQDLASEARKQTGQRLGSHGETDTSSPLGEHVPLVKRLGGVTPFPDFTMHVHRCFMYPDDPVLEVGRLKLRLAAKSRTQSGTCGGVTGPRGDQALAEKVHSLVRRRWPGPPACAVL